MVMADDATAEFAVASAWLSRFPTSAGPNQHLLIVARTQPLKPRGREHLASRHLTRTLCWIGPISLHLVGGATASNASSQNVSSLASSRLG